MFSQDQWSQLLANFLEEARDLIQQAETILLALDNGDGDDGEELLNSLFRAVHTALKAVLMTPEHPSEAAAAFDHANYRIPHQATQSRTTPRALNRFLPKVPKSTQPLRPAANQPGHPVHLRLL